MARLQRTKPVAFENSSEIWSGSRFSYAGSVFWSLSHRSHLRHATQTGDEHGVLLLQRQSAD